VFHDWTISATYVGNHVVDEWHGIDINQIELRNNGFLNAFKIAQQNYAANGSPTNGQSLGALQTLFAEVPSSQYNLYTTGQAATLANFLNTILPRAEREATMLLEPDWHRTSSVRTHRMRMFTS